MYTLTTDEMQNLKDLVKELDGSVRSYSGRAMYGSECLGVVLSHESVSPFLFELGKQCADYSSTFESVIGQTKQDSMGLDTILYWPRLAPPEQEKGEVCEFCGADIEEDQDHSECEEECEEECAAK